MQIYSLTLCPSCDIDLLYRWNYLAEMKPRLQFVQLGPRKQRSGPNILLWNEQIHTEASDTLYGQAISHLHCHPSPFSPFPGWPLRGIRKPMRDPNGEGD